MQLNESRLGYSVSVISTTPTIFLDSVPLLESTGMDRIHVDVMDGDFVPRFGLYPEFVSEIRGRTRLPIDVHMMIRSPEKYVADFAAAGATRIVPHIEPVEHLSRLVSAILESGVEAGLALNPHTDFSSLKYVLGELNCVMLMAINPGIVGHKAIPATLAKVRDASEYLSAKGFEGNLEVDGGVLFNNVRAFASSGADTLVVGAGTLFNPGRPLEDNIRELNSLR